MKLLAAAFLQQFQGTIAYNAAGAGPGHMHTVAL